jgi:hypothetical protein
MDEQAIRTRIRALMASEALPKDPYAGLTSMEVGHHTLPEERCTVCQEGGPHVSYMYGDGKLLRLHADCDALWREERPLS